MERKERSIRDEGLISRHVTGSRAENDGPEKRANQDIIHPQKEGHDEMLKMEEQHAALDPNRLKGMSLNALGIWRIVGRTMYEKSRYSGGELHDDTLAATTAVILLLRRRGCLERDRFCLEWTLRCIT
jgi:hypothetical protein